MRALFIIATLVALAGCNELLVPNRTFEVVLEQPDGFDPLPVQVVDRTGYLEQVAIRQGDVLPPFEGRGGVSSPAGRPNELVVQWVGGACDERVRLVSSIGGEGRFHLELSTEVAPGGCDAIGVPRALGLILNVALDPSNANLDLGAG